MKKFGFTMAILALVLVFGLAFVGCKNDTTVDEIYGCAYSEKEVSSDNTNTHYLLSISYNDALTKLNQNLGNTASPVTMQRWGFSSIAWMDNVVWLEVVHGVEVRLFQNGVGGSKTGMAWNL